MLITAYSKAAPCSPIWRATRRPRTTLPTNSRAHFVADEPPPTLVAKLEKTFNDSGGNLKAVAESADHAPMNHGCCNAPS